ncbi:MAG: alpha/beta hydrolase [Bacteroidales bacterium]|nr:alpha/beta hydrolase [Bacteroidales bacterium]
MELNFTISDGTPIRGEMHEPSGECRGVLVLIHGLGEHFGRYRQWAQRFVSAGYAVYGADLPGHGVSGGSRGHISSYSAAGEIIDNLTDMGHKRFPGAPVIIYGHSLGGGIVLRYLIESHPDICCAIVTSPWLKLAFEPPRIKLLLAKAVKGIAPRMAQPSGLVVDYISRDTEVVEEYKNDPLVHDRISVSLFNSAVDAAAYSLSEASGLKVPLLLMHGGGDLITSPEGSRLFAASSSLTELKIWEGGYHELHNDVIREEVFGYLAGWLERQLSER